MKRTVLLLCPVALLVVAVGCDKTAVSALPSEVQAMVSSIDGLKTDVAARLGESGSQDQLQIQDRLQLMDGSCDGDGNQYRYGGSGGPGGPGGGNGGGDQDRLQLRDGSCQSGG
jgi:hypothetical protein